MTITKLERQKHDRERVSIFIDGEFAIGILEELLLNFGIRRGAAVSEADIEQWKAAQEFFEAKKAAFNYLSMRMHSVKELSTKLRDKGFSAPVIEDVLKRMDELNLTDDKQYAEALLRDRLKRKTIGKRALQSELFKKGIDRETASDALAATDLNADALCLKAAEKKMKSLVREPDLRKRKRKLSDYLMRRGFEWEVIRATVDKLMKEVE